MAIYGIGSIYNKTDDYTKEFIDNDFIEVGWSYDEAPDLHELMKSIKVGDIVFIKRGNFGSLKIKCRAIGKIIDNKKPKKFIDLKTKSVKDVDCDKEAAREFKGCGRNVKWLITKEFPITNPISSKTDEDKRGKNNVVSNTIYQEFHPVVQKEIIDKIV
jgi:hypothetical protein